MVKPPNAPDNSVDDVRASVLKVMADTANGCLSELGYFPGIIQRLNSVEHENALLRADNIKMYADNRRLAELAVQQNERYALVTAPDTVRLDMISSLKQETASLKKELDGHRKLGNATGHAQMVNDFNALRYKYIQALDEIAELRQARSSPYNGQYINIFPQESSQGPSNVISHSSMSAGIFRQHAHAPPGSFFPSHHQQQPSQALRANAASPSTHGSPSTLIASGTSGSQAPHQGNGEVAYALPSGSGPGGHETRPTSRQASVTPPDRNSNTPVGHPSQLIAGQPVSGATYTALYGPMPPPPRGQSGEPHHVAVPHPGQYPGQYLGHPFQPYPQPYPAHMRGPSGGPVTPAFVTPPEENGWFVLESGHHPQLQQPPAKKRRLESREGSQNTPIGLASAPVPASATDPLPDPGTGAELSVDDVLHSEYIDASPPGVKGTELGLEEEEEEDIVLDAEGLRPVDVCLGIIFVQVNDAPVSYLCKLCRARVEKGVIGSDTLFSNPEHSTLVAHCTEEHGQAWATLRNPHMHT